MARSKESQSKHDSMVRKDAQELKKRGFNVQADVEGFPRPDTIGGYRPDIIATKGGRKKIIEEVETPESKDITRSEKQRRAFKREADRSNGSTSFIRKIAK